MVHSKNGHAGKLHMELRHPSIGISIEEKAIGKRVVIVLGTDPTDFRGEVFNGAVVEVTPEWIDRAIEELHRAKELHAREVEQDHRNGKGHATKWEFPNALEAVKIREA